MKKNRSYRITVLVLSLIVIVQWIFIYLLAHKPKELAKVVPQKPPHVVKGRIAIVLDDWGYNFNNFAILDQLRAPITLSVLPQLPYSRKVAERGMKRGYEMILHLPMEPYEKLRLEQNTVLTAMDARQIRQILNSDLDSLVFAKGVSNHMGSRATGDPRVMGIVFGELKKRNLYFLDSFVSPRTVCEGLAAKTGIRFIRRDVFLDNKEDPAYIKGQLYKLKAKADAFGRAVGIGHDRRVTLETLKEVIPELEKEGYRFVFLSDVAQ